MKIDFEKLKNDCGLDFANNKQDLIFYIQSILYNLKTHNKNYTKAQYERICLLADIFDCIEE